MGTVTNLQTVRGDVAPSTNGNAQGSRHGEDNSRHVAVAIGALALLAIGAGLVNVKVAAGRQS